MQETNMLAIAREFALKGEPTTAKPLGNGLINETFKVETAGDAPDYVLQCINEAIFTDVDLLQNNIQAVTDHVREKLRQRGEGDISRKALQFAQAKDGGKTYVRDTEGKPWRMSEFIPGAETFETVNPKYSKEAGAAFGDFEKMLSDIPVQLGETIPDFHNMELRLRQLREAAAQDKAGRLGTCREETELLLNGGEAMCLAERLHREGLLPKRACHCDTKVNNMMFDSATGKFLLVIDLDTVMPSYVFSDYGDFLRTAANEAPEDEPDLSKVRYREDIFEAFTEGYLSTAAEFLTKTEVDNLPYAAQLFPFMQACRFLADWLNGDTYYKITRPEHNLDRTRNQIQLYKLAAEREEWMRTLVGKLSRQ